MLKEDKKYKIAVIGLGYVGLPLAVKFGAFYDTVGFDINKDRIKELLRGEDSTREIETAEINLSKKIRFSHNSNDLEDADIYIVTVPTPINKFREPNLGPIFSATRMISRYLKKGNIIVYESTVYPGCTESDCVPILEKESKLKYKKDFHCGYSPERIVPGDKERTLTKIKKIVSASNEKTLKILEKLYSSIIDAGIYLASSIEVAEAAKSIENAQRDINIAFVNELALIFDKMNINTHEVLEAASTKWNFLPFSPGLVGGHCIGVDPYYLAYKSASYGHHPKLILAGREINDKMSEHIVKKVMREMALKNINIEKARILILGITFKEDCPDIRNTKIIDVVNIFSQFNNNIDIADPVADPDEVRSELGINLKATKNLKKKYDVILRLVSHKEFDNFSYDNLINKNSIIFDLKGNLKRENVIYV